MTKKTALILLAVASAAVAAALLFRAGSGPGAGPDPVGPPDGSRRGALVDEVVFTQEADLGKAIELIERGNYHVYAAGVTNQAVFRRLRASARLAYDFSYGTSGELTLNPAGPRFEDGSLNPFHVRAIREALQWLVDRRYIAEEIYGGLAVPRWLPINTAFPDYARLAGPARALELRYAHDPDRGRAVIEREMKALGATLVNGRWHFEGAPLRLKVLIRTETERRRLGDYLAGLLEDAGFEVERMYRAADEASRIWIAGDPRAGGWHAYTGGWVSTVILRDLAGNLDYYYTRRGRPEPLWQAYEPDPELDAIADRLQRRDFAGWAERERLFARGLELAMADSVRVWLVDELNAWPRARDLRLAVDLAGGVSGSSLWPYTLRFEGRTGGRVVIGTPNLLTEPWNPVDGTNWIFDRMIIRALEDAELLPDPYTGLYLPQRIRHAQVTVRRGTPVVRTLDWLDLETAADIRVPADAWLDWHAREGRFITVGERYPSGVSARTRVRLRYEAGYFDRFWHDGSRVSPADVLVGWLLGFERAKEESPYFDQAHAPAFESFQHHYRGWRILSLEPFEVEIYSDQVFPDAEWIAGARAPSAAPWHVIAVAMLAERSGELAFSSDKADRLKVDWMNFVAGPSLGILERHLEAARSGDFLPFAGVLGAYLRPGEMAERYRALAEWYGKYHHFWVGDGPFYLHSVHPVERSVVLRRFEGFPDAADKWLRFSEPRIPVLDLDGPMVLEVGRPAIFDLRIEFGGRPYPAEDIERAGYLVYGSAGVPAAHGEAKPVPGEAGRWRIALSGAETAKLGVGANTLEVAVSSLPVALPSFASFAFATMPGGGTGE